VSKSLKKQRQRKWQADPRCEQCGVVTMLPEHLARRFHQPVLNLAGIPAEFRNRMATIEHVRSRLHPLRRVGTGKHQLLCWLCNQKRNDGELALMPLEELWARSGALERMRVFA
jgi:hypothetical protein